MTNKQIYQYYGEVENYTEPEAFASDVALSLLNPEDPNQNVDIEEVEQLERLWRVARLPFREFLNLLGLSQTNCSIRFCIPRRTVQEWAGERRKAPPYVRLMMAECTGYLRSRKNALK